MPARRDILLAGLALGTAAAAPAVFGAAVFGDWRDSAPGETHLIRPGDLPPPGATRSAAQPAEVIPRPEGALPQAPAGFHVELFAAGLEGPRTLRVAPNGDLFAAESRAGRIRVMRARPGRAHPAQVATFADHLDRPYGMAFYPPGPDPAWIYVGETGRVLRYPYRGDFAPAGRAEVIIPRLPTGGHWTRDLAVAPDGRSLFVSVGSRTNDATDLPPKAAAEIAAIQRAHGIGAAWGGEADRADVLVFDPLGRTVRHYANGLRNCSGEAIEPTAGTLWCAVNERDGLGDNLPPDYATGVRAGGFYGWPWFYTGDREDPRFAGKRPDLAGSVLVPDVLIQPHSAPLGIAFYEGAMFPAEYRGNAFVTLHGSWNRSRRTGYKVIRLPMRAGRPAGGYVDFLTGFATDAGVWGRPVGVATAHDGALLVSEDANGTIWRVSYGA